MNEIFNHKEKKSISLYKQRNVSSASSSSHLNGAAVILGDNIRDFRRDIEITKMNNNYNSNITLTNPNNNSNYSHINIRKLPTIPTIPQPSTTTHYNHPSFHLTPLKQLSHTNSASNIKSNNHNMNITSSSQYNELLSEIHKLKSTQSELQHKLQNNETRLTEMIISFNNYIQLNEQSTQTIHNIQTKIDTFISQQDLLEMKNTLYTINKTNETTLHDLSLKVSALNIHINELTQDNETYKKYINDTIQHIHSDAMQSRFAQQNELLKLEENKEMKLLMQVNQMKNNINNVERSIREECELRKQITENIRNDISNAIKQMDEKVRQVQVSVKEIENNVYKGNKECMGMINEMVGKNKEYYECELNSVRTIIESGLSKINFKLENDNQVYKDNLMKIKHTLYTQKNKINEIDDCLKDAIHMFQKSVH